MKQNMKYSFIFLFLLFTALNAFSGKNSVSSILWKPDMEFTGFLVVKDPMQSKFNAWEPAEFEYERYQKIRLFWDFEKTETFFSGSWSYKIQYRVSYFDNTISDYVQYPTLEELIITNSSSLKEFEAINIHHYDKAELKIDIVDVIAIHDGLEISNPDESNLIPDEIGLEFIMEDEYFRDVNYTLDTEVILLYASLEKYYISWNYLLGAEEYELEWVFVDEYSVIQPTTVASAFQLFEPVRVTLKNNYFDFDMIYPTGNIYYRVRGVGKYIGTDYRKTGEWLYAELDDVFSISTNVFADKNMSCSIIYAEDGKNKKEVSYYDGTLRNRQNQTKLSTNDVSIVQETKYDYEGRPVVSILPVPANSSDLLFKPDFNLFGTDPFEREDFDGKETTEQLSTSAGASQYYSPENDFSNNFEKVTHNQNYIPDADGYVYSQVEYTRDNTGRVTRENNIGDIYQKGSDHQVEYYYCTPTQTELNILFGPNVGNARHYKKQIQKDENDQYTAFYFDMAGKMIAKVLIGSVPDNLMSLASNPQNYHFNLNENNVLSHDGKISISVNHFFNDQDDKDYTFYYSFLHGGSLFLEEMFGINICIGCEYELELTAKNEDGTPLNFAVNDGISIINSTDGMYTSHIEPPECDEGGYDYNKLFTISFTDVDAGAFTVTKKLRVTTENNEALIADALSAITTSTPYITHLTDVYNSSLSTVDFTDCDINCYQSCITAVINEYSSNCGPQGDTNWCFNDFYDIYPNMEQWGTQHYQNFLNEIDSCTADTCGLDEYGAFLPEIAANSCDAIYNQMINDVSPNNEGVEDDGFHFAEDYATGDDHFWYRVRSGMANSTYVFRYPDNTIIQPENIAYIMDADNWNDDWAEILVLEHREYCQYQKCQTTIDTRNFSAQLTAISSWTEAYNTGFLNPFNINLDPDHDVTILVSGVPDQENLGYVGSVNCESVPSGIDPWLCYEIENGDEEVLFDRLNNFSATGISLWEYIETDYIPEYYSSATNEEKDVAKWQFFMGVYNALKEQRFDEVFQCEYFDDDNVIVSNPHLPVPPESGGLGGTFDDTYFTELAGAFQNSHDCQNTVDGWFITMQQDYSGTWLSEEDSIEIRELFLQYCENICLNENPLEYINVDDLASSPLSGVQTILSPYSWDLADPEFNNLVVDFDDVYIEFSSELSDYTYLCVCNDYRALLDFVNIQFILNSNTNVTWTGVLMENYIFSATTNTIVAKPDIPSSYSDVFVFWADLGSGLEQIDIEDIVRIYRPSYLSVGPEGLTNFKNLTLRMEITVGSETEIYQGYVTGLLATDPCEIEKSCSYNRPIDDDNSIDPVLYHIDCVHNLEDIANSIYLNTVSQIEDSISMVIYQAFETACSGFIEDFYYDDVFPDTYIELYYYDLLGNLVQTVQPQGVQLVPPTMFDGTGGVPMGVYEGGATNHSYLTTYAYNSINQIGRSTTPETGVTFIAYDEVGRVSTSSNSVNTSYVVYDNQGRPVETGKDDGSSVSDVTRTYYDEQFSNSVDHLFGIEGQKNLRSRVVSSEKDEDGDFESEFASIYSYDAHGNVMELVQRDLSDGGIGSKKLEYVYDLVSGNVKSLAYQTGNLDQFFHKYEYDADNRLTNVYTSEDNMIWHQDAKYFYYLHGPLARIEIGNYKVQGLDYAYNLFGWLKGVNSNTLKTNRDIGKDGNINNLNLITETHNIHKKIAKDEIGYSLGYYSRINTVQIPYNKSDFTPIYSFLESEKFEATPLECSHGQDFHNLYNGNIGKVVTAINQFDGAGDYVYANTYIHDQLNRIRNMNQYAVNRLDNIWTGNELDRYALDVDYDKNGNILSMKNNPATSSSGLGQMDDFTYDYTPETEKPQSNILASLTETNTSGTNWGDIKYNQGYVYNDIGNLTEKTENSETTFIDWTLDNKVKSVTQESEELPDLEFQYDAFGNRVKKIVTSKSTPAVVETTYYVLDAHGNMLADYTKTSEQENPYLNSYYIYGSNRLGMLKVNKEMDFEPQYIEMDDFEFEQAARGTCRTEILATGTVGNPTLVAKVDGTNISGTGVSWPNKTTGSQNLVDAINNHISKPIDYKAEIDSIAGDTVYMYFYTDENTEDANDLYFTLDGGGQNVTMPQAKILEGHDAPLYLRLLQKRQYELTNHLGNVLTTVTDTKYPFDIDENGTVDWFEADVVSASDYYAFGSLMPDRNASSDSYRFGFQGQEAENEITGQTGSHSFYKYRISDNRIGRFFAVDPLTAKYPWNSPYGFSENRVVDGIELEGLEWKPIYDKQGNISDYEWVGYLTGWTTSDGFVGENKTDLPGWSVRTDISEPIAPKGTVEEAQLNYFENGTEYSLYFGVTADKKPVTEHYLRAPWLWMARLNIGLTEGNNATIQGWIDSHNSYYGASPILSDNEPWCGIFVYACLSESGYPLSSNSWQTPALNTFYCNNWNEGTIINNPAYGAIAVMTYGHVAMVVDYDATYVWILGGNQPLNGAVVRDGVEVNITKYRRSLVSKYVLPSGYIKPPLD